MQGYGGPQQRARDGGGSIRHAYPLSSTSTGFFAALLLVLRTLPYAFVRFLAHVLHFVVALALIGGSCVLAAIVGSAVHPGAGVAV
ncbi:MAG TPA: hypothetical protein VF407_09260, partial [Polyangiaceae bacterium]